MLPLSSPVTRALDDVLSQYARRRLFGGAAAVLQRDRKRLLTAVSMADAESGIPNRTTTRFHLGSATKMLVAIGARTASERAGLPLDAPIAHLYPELPGADGITPRHLLTNTAGVPDYLNHEVFTENQHSATPRSVFIDAVAHLPRPFAPGEAFAYSNTNWLILAEVLERALGRSLPELMHELVFSPLGMSDTTIATSQLEGARGYSVRGGQLVPAEHVHPSALDAAGAAVSTVQDLWTLDWALRRGELLPREVSRQMHTPLRANYGEGVFVDPVLGRICVYHEGGMFGFACGFYRFVDDDSTIILLSNQMDTPLRSIRDALAASLFDEEVHLDLDREAVEVPEEDLVRYRGRYRGTYKGRPFVFDIERRGSSYVMDIERWTTIELTPIGRDRFFAFAKGGEMEAHFIRNDERPCQMVEFLWAGEELVAERVGSLE